MLMDAQQWELSTAEIHTSKWLRVFFHNLKTKIPIQKNELHFYNKVLAKYS